MVKTQFVATSQANIVKKALLEARLEGCDVLGLKKAGITVEIHRFLTSWQRCEA